MGFARKMLSIIVLDLFTMISDFVDYLKDKWNVGYSGIIGYMNYLSHMLGLSKEYFNTQW